MTKTEQARLNLVHDQANKLMDGKGNGITTSDVVESLLGDIRLIQSGHPPEYLSQLVQLDAQRETA